MVSATSEGRKTIQKTDPVTKVGKWREASAGWQRQQRFLSADIGELPKVVNRRRRNKCAKSLKLFLETYFPQTTGLKPFSQDHVDAIGWIESCILHGGQFAQAVYRGFGKSTITENATLWAVLYGYRKLVYLLGANEESAESMLDSIKRELESNDLLMEDFPEICHGIRALEGKAQRCATQTYKGERTLIGWNADEVVLPTIGKSKASGCKIVTSGITAAGRGKRFKRPDGTQQRPDLILLDDPQTDESAASPTQVAKRLSILTKSIKQMSGHFTSIAILVNGTVIEPDDLMDQLTNVKKNPSWQSRKVKMVKSFSDHHEDLWLESYAAIRNTYDPETPGDQQRAHRAATAFYEAHRSDMDAGCQVSWEHCYREGVEVSAIQHAYNILIDDGDYVFNSECQNDPTPPSGDLVLLRPLQVAGKISGYDRGEVPPDCTTVTAFIDVQGKMLWWTVVAWDEAFRGYVLDYGAWPDQRRRYYTLADARVTLRTVLPGVDEEGCIYNGLVGLSEKILGKEWMRRDGAPARVNRCFVDAGWGQTSNTIKSFCRQSVYAPILYPSHGKGIKASQSPIADWQGRHWKKGHNWVISRPPGREIPSVTYDTNYWKKRVFDGLSMHAGSRGAIVLFKADTDIHSMIGQQLTSEVPVKTEANMRTVYEWNEIPGRDNHLWDCLVGSMVAASVNGLTRDIDVHKAAKRQRYSLADLQARKRGLVNR